MRMRMRINKVMILTLVIEDVAVFPS